MAARPASVSLKITSPKAGDTVAAGELKVTVDYAGPTPVAAAQATRLEDLHFHYFLDEDATPYIGKPVEIPSGNPKIAHSAATSVTFQNVAAGSHTVTVVVGGRNHVSTNPPLSDKVTFTVK
jgi:hypothetical protein